MLSIDQITTKNDRLVLPVKAGYKSQVSGLIHAQSATGQTLYIEPEVVVGMNNQLSVYQSEENEEIARILYELSQIVKGHYYHFRFNLEILEELILFLQRHNMVICITVVVQQLKKMESK